VETKTVIVSNKGVVVLVRALLAAALLLVPLAALPATAGQVCPGRSVSGPWTSVRVPAFPTGDADAGLHAVSPSRPDLLFADLAPDTHATFDAETLRVLERAERSAADLLVTHRPAVDALVDRLLAEETLEGPALHGLLPKPALPAQPSGRRRTRTAVALQTTTVPNKVRRT
jgi:hypothetical protein